MTDHDDDEPAYDLVMPFVTVTSKGGPHDDQAYVAGWHMGGIDATLRSANPAVYEAMIRTDSTPQADLIAMRNGYNVRFDMDVEDGWTRMTLARATEWVPRD